MIGHKYSGALLLSVMSVSAALSDQSLPIKTKSIIETAPAVQSVEERVVADARKNIQEALKNNASIERVVCSYGSQAGSVKAHFTDYRRKPEVFGSTDASLLANSNITQMTVVYVKHEEDVLGLKYSDLNGKHSKEIACNNIKVF
jgi:hypothetical protein